MAVTGAGGFIGSAVVRLLLDLGAEVRPLVHYRGDGGRGLLDELAGADDLDVRGGDVRDAEWVRRSIDGAEVVIHLAALVGIPYSYVAPRDVVDVNLGGTLNVLEAARHLGTARIVCTSTSEVYGSAQVVPIDERHPLNAQSPYAASKVAADQLALSYHRSFDVPVALARPFNTYGPGQSVRAVVPTVVRQALAGEVVRLGATSPTRDLNFVEDTAAGILAIARCDEAVGTVLNIGSGVETSIGEVVQLVGSAIGRDLSVVMDEARVRPDKSEVDRLVADPSRLQQATGWSSTVTVSEGIARTVDWCREHPDALAASRYGV